jgi:lipoyl(octanoyl) transferase
MGIDLVQYVRNLEEVVIRVLRKFSIEAVQISGYPGVWVGNDKICALGIRISHWITSHGFALNVNNDLNYFSYINPCGISNGAVTSVSAILGRDVSIDDVVPCLLQQFSQVFCIELSQESISYLDKYL